MVVYFLFVNRLRGNLIMKKSAKALASVAVAAAAVVLTGCASGTGSWGSCGVKEAPATCKGMSCKGQNGCKGGGSCKQDSCK